MAYGLQIKNDDSDILVDSNFHHYHFAAKLTHYEATAVPDIVGGKIVGHTTTAGQYISNKQITGDIFKFQLPIGIAHASSTAAPMCFIKPASTGVTAPACGIVLMQRTGTAAWDIWVLQDDGYPAPVLYCFLPLSEMTAAQQATDANNTMGLQTFNSSGSRTYDSRLKPLKIVGTTSATVPTIARTAAIENNTWNPDFEPDQVKDHAFTTSTTEQNANDLMFYCPSFAHACQQYIQSTDGDGFQTKGYNSYFYAWARADLWWCFYRATYRLTSATNFRSTYTIYASGHVWDSDEDSAGILTALVLAVLAVFTFGATLAVGVAVLAGGAALTASMVNAGVADGVYLPYENGSRNTAQANPVLFSKASYYD
jgi:hypothetical protein